MRIIEEAAIRDVVSVADARQAVRDAFCAFAAGGVIAPDEMAMKLDHGGELHVKGAYLGGDVIAFKSATGGFPGGGNSGFTAVLDAHTGAPVAILRDGGWLTEMRTAAASAVSALALARPEASPAGHSRRWLPGCLPSRGTTRRVRLLGQWRFGVERHKRRNGLLLRIRPNL